MKFLQNMGSWDAGIHSDPEQVKRMLSAHGLKSSIVSFSASDGVIRIQGSEAEPYKATLAGCGCADFARRQMPCKHMYALAAELGILDLSDLKKSGENAKKEFSADLAKYRHLYESGELSGDSYVKICTALSKAK
nr:SWIM zinc finger family protein [uncultured Dysosmobacter sp.]